MADSKISALTTLAQADLDAAADFVPIVEPGATPTKKITPDDLVAGSIEQGAGLATQAQQETGTATTVWVSPARQQYHPSAAKAWIRCDMAGTINSSYNITSITDSGTGVVTITIATDFSSANWCPVANIDPSGGGIFGGVSSADVAAGSFVVRSYNTTTQTLQDTSGVYAVCFGDQS